MRILATFRHSDGVEQEAALEELRIIFANHYLIPIEDPREEREVFGQMVADMNEGDRRRFEATWRVLVRDPQRGTIGSVSVLPRGHLLVRLRSATLQKLVPVGHGLIEEVMNSHGPKDDGSKGMFELVRCEVRERGVGDGFLHGAWKGGERSFLRFLFAQRRATFIVAFFLLGLALEVVLTLWPSQANVAELGLRLGAPMLVSSLVLLMERRAQWRDQREPRLIWSPYQDSGNYVDPFRMQDVAP